MQVVLLCGGWGTRLREETAFIPKPMVQIGERPIVWHIMSVFSRYGLNDFVLALGYKGHIIKEYFYFYEFMNSDFTVHLGSQKDIKVHSDHAESDWTITLVNTGLKALKGARLKRVQRYVTSDTFLMTYGDGLSDVDVSALIEFHKSHGKIATVTGVNPGSQFGVIKTAGDRVEAFAEKPRRSDSLVNGGYFVFNRAIFDYLQDQDDCDLEVGTLDRLAKDGELMVFRHDGFWDCMDTQRDRDRLNALWESGKAPWAAR
jgi:glucose-1-phosphate cytidylyltransferase